MRLLRTCTPLTLIVACSVALSAQRQAAVDAAIERIERALLPPVLVTGRPVETKSLAERMRDLKVPAVSVAVFRNGRIEWTRAWGMADVESGRKATPTTRFQAASISKPVAAAAVLALVSRQRLSLDTPVNDVLVSWKLPDNEHTNRTPVTLRHLLTHSAGTTVSGFRGYARGEEVPTLLQLLDGAPPANSAPVRVDIPVGSRWRYSGGGISIAQLVVENVTRQPFSRTARELVLTPAGMTHSTYEQPLPAAVHTSAATGYGSSGQPVSGKWHTYPEQAAAGLWTTPEDLARFAMELQQTAAGRSSRLMSRRLAQDMLRRHVEDWGLGLGVAGEGTSARFRHGGSNQGFRAFWVGYRERASGVVVMTNSDAGSPLANDIVRTVAREYGFDGLGPVQRVLGTADPGTYPDLAGEYELPGGTSRPVQIIADEGRLFRSTGPNPADRTELLPEGPDRFFALDGDVSIQFVRDGTGRVTEARLVVDGQERRAKRRVG